MARTPLLRGGVAVAIAAALVLAAPLALDQYAISILIRSFLFGAIAVTVDILWGYCGVLSFGQATYFGIGAYAFGLAVTQIGLSPGVALGALAAGCAVSALVAWLIAWLGFGPRVTPLYISVITLVEAVIFVQLIYSGGDFTGSSSGLSGFDTFDVSMEGWFRIAGLFLLAAVVLGAILVRSDAGRLLVAIRENEQRCRYCGIATARVKGVLLAGAAVIAALAGYAYAGYTDVIAPDLGNFQFGTELVIWVALGGRGTLYGPAAAAVLIDYASAYLGGTLPFIWQLIVGLVFIVVIVLMPQGIGPAVASLARRRPRAVAPPALATVADAEVGGDAAKPAIAVAGLSRHYGSLRVLDGIDFTARAGELVSLVGPNGAGKTTLIRCLSDGAERSGGSVAIEGTPIGRAAPEACVRLGLGRKFQAPNVFETLTVADALRIARARQERLSPWRRAQSIALPAAARLVLQATGLEDALATEVRHLSHGAKQALELAMVLAMQPRVLLLDEPTAGLTKGERTLIGGILTDLVRRHGLCILLVEHDLEFVREISSRIIVLHQGRILLDGSVAEVTGSELVRSIYTGTPEPAAA
ncbi:branched-chain amino acid ABC transporter ATP-binding protein/permease [Acidisphaera rubrifaciens]|uniref:ABC transporter branched chain amino-acid permease n=1 Tax=Acidisphaera rubrifaciens HS-AP3 TaxID=1231350 RepID=A0A0D6P7G5_9PROT|nr:ATP-binding cassette domain-containing protein [Acidisphaera rubrifaciens]GAN77138.1 ABC transporter branched chain amino-acid permease [Acidisphaera rubrifaciens HS-AP3]